MSILESFSLFLLFLFGLCSYLKLCHFLVALWFASVITERYTSVKLECVFDPKRILNQTILLTTKLFSYISVDCFSLLLLFVFIEERFLDHIALLVRMFLLGDPWGRSPALPVALISNKQWITNKEQIYHSVFFMRKCQGNAPKARDFPYILHSGHMTAVLQPQAASNVCGFWLSSVRRTAGSDINGDWVEFMWKRQWWLIKWKDFGGSGKTDWIPIYSCNHILLQGQKNRLAASIVVMEKIVGLRA